MPRALHMHCHRAPVNWVPWSEVMVAGIPKCGHPQHGKACQGGGEGEGGGHPGGVLRLGARRGVHRTTGRHVLLPILCAGEGAEEVAAGDRSYADMGICD